MLRDNNEKKIVLSLVTVLFFVVNFATLKDGHNWGDDFAQYVLCAKNIADHRTYTDGIMLDNPTIYPPGFPLLLAPLIKIFGIDFKILKSLNIIFWFLSALIFYALARKRLPEDIAVLSYVLLLSSSFFFTYKQNILSDIPFVFFCLLSLWLWERSPVNQASPSPPRTALPFAIFLIVMSFTLLIRSAGLALFVAGILYFLIGERNYRKAALCVLALFITMILQTAWIGTNPGFLTTFVNNSPETVIGSIKSNFSIVFLSTLFFFLPAYNAISLNLFFALAPFIKTISPLLLIFFLGVFFYRIKKRSLSPAGYFFSSSLCLALLWSVFAHPVDAFVRFILPIAALLLLYFSQFWLYLGKKIQFKRADLAAMLSLKIILIFLIFVNVSNTISVFNFNDDVLKKRAVQELTGWLEDNTKSGDHFMFWKPRALTLLTGRVGTPHWIDSPADWEERVNRFDIRCLIMSKRGDTELIKALDQKPDFYETVWENNAFKIYRVKDYLFLEKAELKRQE